MRLMDCLALHNLQMVAAYNQESTAAVPLAGFDIELSEPHGNRDHHQH